MRVLLAHSTMNRQQRGAATLVVVMVLFFIVSLVAAYTGRNLIFEQRTSANQYRSSQAFEAAEAGLEWAIAQLNGGRIDASCQPSDEPTDDSFRQRYLDVDATTGQVTRRIRTTGTPPLPPLFPGCVFDGTAWQCSCPDDGPPALSAPSGVGPMPAFRVQFLTVAGQPGIVQILSNGCTRLDDDCLDFPGLSVAGEGRARVTAHVALKSGLMTPPSAALTARDSVGVDTPTLKVYNTDPASGGVTIHAGSVDDANIEFHGIPGAASELSWIDDLTLAPLPVSRMFASVFGLWPDMYRQQPATIFRNCALNPCTAAELRDLIARNPGRMLWLVGDVDFDSTGDIGAAAEPVVIIATGSVTFSASGVRVFGLVYSRSDVWSIDGVGEIQGAAVAEQAFGGNGGSSIVFDADILNRLRVRSGSFVRVPGSWRDY